MSTEKEENNKLLAAVIGNVPDVMAELTRSYIASTDYNVRAKIKMRMKAILDMLSVDSTYPNSPAVGIGPQIPDEDFNPAMMRPGIAQVRPNLPPGIDALQDYMVAGPRPYPIGGPLPAPGMANANANADFLR